MRRPNRRCASDRPRNIAPATRCPVGGEAAQHVILAQEQVPEDAALDLEDPAGAQRLQRLRRR